MKYRHISYVHEIIIYNLSWFHENNLNRGIEETDQENVHDVWLEKIEKYSFTPLFLHMCIALHVCIVCEFPESNLPW